MSTNANGTTIEVSTVQFDLPLLVNLASGEIILRDGGTASVPLLSNIDGAGFSVYGGVTLAIPAATSYTSAAFSQERYWQASGPGSRLDLPNVESVAITVSGDKRLTIQANDSGVVRVPKLTRAAGASLELNGTEAVVVDIGQFTEFTSGRLVISESDRTFSQLADARGTSFEITGVQVGLPVLRNLTNGGISLQAGGTALVPLLSTIDGAEFNVYGGVTLTIPTATSYTSASLSQERYWRAAGAGSRLELANVETVTIAAGGDYRLLIQATDSGVVKTPKLSRARGVELELNGTNLVETGQFTEFTGGRLTVSGGDREFPQLIDASGTALEITGVHVDFPVLESLTAGGIILRDGGTASVPMLAHGDGADFHVYDGVTLTLPALMTFDAGAAADGGALPAHLPESGQGDQPDSVRQQSGSPPGTDPGHVHLPHPCLEAILDQEQPPDEVAEPVDASGQSWFVVAGITCANTAAHDLAGRAIGNAVVRNCRFVRIGGGHLYNRSNPTRYGNGIEFWCACENNLVEGCQFAHVYDTAMTIQGPEPCTVRNMTCGPTGASSANSHRGLTRGFGGRRWLATR